MGKERMKRFLAMFMAVLMIFTQNTSVLMASEQDLFSDSIPETMIEFQEKTQVPEFDLSQPESSAQEENLVVLPEENIQELEEEPEKNIPEIPTEKTENEGNKTEKGIFSDDTFFSDGMHYLDANTAPEANAELMDASELAAALRAKIAILKNSVIIMQRCGEQLETIDAQLAELQNEDASEEKTEEEKTAAKEKFLALDVQVKAIAEEVTSYIKEEVIPTLPVPETLEESFTKLLDPELTEEENAQLQIDIVKALKENFNTLIADLTIEEQEQMIDDLLQKIDEIIEAAYALGDAGYLTELQVNELVMKGFLLYEVFYGATLFGDGDGGYQYPGTRQKLTVEGVGDTTTPYYYAKETINGEDKKLLVYCFNSELNWPHTSGSFGNDYYVPDALEYLDDAVKDKLYRIFYAGYPYNSANLYVDENHPYEATMEELEASVKPPESVITKFPNIAWDELEFSLATVLDPTTRESAAFTEIGETLNYFLTNYDEEFADYLVANYPQFWTAVNNVYDENYTLEGFAWVFNMNGAAMWASSVDADAAHAATQIAVWRILYENGVPNNGKDQMEFLGEGTLARKLVDFANGVGKYANISVPPRENTISVMEDHVRDIQDENNKGNYLIRENGSKVGNDKIKFIQKADGLYHSEPLYLNSSYIHSYKIVLQNGSEIIAETTNNGVEPFQLVTDEKPENYTLHISASNYFPSDVYQYINEKEVGLTAEERHQNKENSVSGKVNSFQDMGGCYYDNVELNISFNTTAIDYTYTEISVKKVWDDQDNWDNLRTDSIVVELLKDGTPVSGKELTLNEGNNWYGSFTGLEDGKYSVREKNVPSGYTAKVTGTQNSGYTITNTHIPEVVNIEGKKTWNDAGNESHRPSSITIRLYADNTLKAIRRISEDEDNHEWKWSFTNLPKTNKGEKKEIKYRIEESPVDGYISTVNGYSITNKITEVKVSKVDIADGKELPGATIQILDSKGTVVEEWVSGTTPHSVKGLKTGETYKLKETVAPTGYDIAVETTFILNEDGTIGSATTAPQKDGVLLVQDKLKEVTKEVKVSKVDIADGKELPGATIQVLDKDKKLVEQWVSGTTPHVVKGLKPGETYTLKETVAPTGYDIAVETTFVLNEDGTIGSATTAPQKDGVLLVQDDLIRINVGVTKVWDDANNQDGKRPASVKIELYADGKATGKTLILNESNQWFGEFTDLDEYKNGNLIAYTVAEEEVKGYIQTVSGSAVRGFVVTNTYSPEHITVTGSKTWNDKNDQNKKRPQSITIRLHANGIVVADTVVTAENNWTWTFTNLPKYAEGKEILYTITEDRVEDYTAIVDGFDVTNNFTPGKTEVEVTKHWNDADNKAGIRPTSVEVELIANGKATGKTVILNEENHWFDEFTELDEYDKDHALIVYTVKEKEVAGYTVEISGSAIHGFVITNSYNSEDEDDSDKTEIQVSKVWNDQNNAQGIRPDSIEVTLCADGKETEQTIVLSEENHWSGKFADLEKYSNGVKIVYTVVEKPVKGYLSEISGNQESGYTITNTIIPEEEEPAQTTVFIKKVKDTETGAALSGAVLAIIDPDNGEQLLQWTSSENPYEIKDKLVAGKTYWLRELRAPNGYMIAEDVEFTVPENGEEITVVMVDEKLPSKTGSIKVKKNVLTYDDDFNLYDVYVKEATFTVGLFLDPEGKHPYGEPQTITIRGDVSGTAVFNNLPSRTFYLFEIDEQGNVLQMEEYDATETYYCTVLDGDGSNELAINLEAGNVEDAINIGNIYSELPEGFYYAGKLTVNKKVLKDGKKYDTKEPFYVGVFSDQNLTQADIVWHQLKNNDAITFEVPVTSDGSQISYWVFETDENGKKIDKNTFGYKVEDGMKVSFSSTQQDQEATIINTVKTEESEKGSSGGGGGGSSANDYSGTSTASAARTADETPIMTYVMMLFAAIAVIAGAVPARRRRRNK